MTRIIVDITELAAWQGKLTGVPRVMDELASRFASQDDVSFVAWDQLAREYFPVEYRAADESHHTTAPTSIQQFKQKGARAIAVAKKIKNRSRIARKLMVIPERAARRVLVPTRENNKEKIVPVKGDTLFILADWHSSDPVFVERVVALKKAGVKLAQISYDLLPVVAPQYSGHSTDTLKRYTTTVYPLCDIIFAISEYTKQDIITWLKQQGLRVPPIEVMRLGDDFALATPQKPTDERFNEVYKRTKDFLLCVGTVEARKNHTLLYYTYKLGHERGIELPPLVVVGRRGWMTENIYEIITTDPVTKDKFIFLHNATDEELSWLYQHCLFSVYASFYEGWGLPIAESIAHGVPCIASNTSSMVEIAGELITYFSPTSTDECLAAIQQLLDPAALKRATTKLSKYQPRSWDETYDSVKGHIEKVHA